MDSQSTPPTLSRHVQSQRPHPQDLLDPLALLQRIHRQDPSQPLALVLLVNGEMAEEDGGNQGEQRLVIGLMELGLLPATEQLLGAGIGRHHHEGGGLDAHQSLQRPSPWGGWPCRLDLPCLKCLPWVIHKLKLVAMLNGKVA